MIVSSVFVLVVKLFVLSEKSNDLKFIVSGEPAGSRVPRHSLTLNSLVSLAPINSTGDRTALPVAFGPN